MARQQDLEPTWAHIQTSLRTTLPESTYQIWLAGLRPVAINDAALYVEVPDETRDWVRRRFGGALSKAATEADPAIRRVQLLGPDQTRSQERTSHAITSREGHDGVPARVFKPGYTFDRFVIGKTNHFAHAAALATAEMPGHAYNPLLVYGPPGVGKTHLLQAIGNYVAAHDAALSVHYTTVEGFTADFTSALKHGKLDLFKTTYRQCDVLLLDDLQFLEGKKKTAEELFHTFDSLMTVGAQIVISSDRHPTQAPFLDTRLKERLEGGLIIDLQIPDRETRLAILRKLVRFNEINIGADAIEHLAARVDWNVRALEGALVRIVAFASLSESEITIDLTNRVLGSLYEDAANQQSHSIKPNPTQIQKSTAVALGLESDELSSTKRSRQVVYARHIAMYLCRELAGLSFPAIARHFQRRDHTTALHAHRKMKAKLLTDQATRAVVTTITDSLYTRRHENPQIGSTAQSQAHSHQDPFSTRKHLPTTTDFQ